MTLPAGIVATPRADGSAVYHLGTIFDGTKPFHVGPYSDNGVNVPAHYWNARWTYRPNPITVKRSPSQIVAANRMFPFGDVGVLVDAIVDDKYAGPMDPSGILHYMPTTGERRDIGLVTDPGASFMLGRSPGPMIAWAQGIGSFPIHFRDETTGKPIDLTKYPQANCYESPAQGQPWMPRFPVKPDGSAAIGGDLYPQQAHFPEAAYLAHIATLDLGFLEELQYCANFMVLCDAIHSTKTSANLTGEVRGVSWGLRNLFMAHVATLDAEERGDLPATCHPSSYWKHLLDNALAYYSPNMADPANQVFRLVTGTSTSWAPWQYDYMLEALAFGVLTGHADWAPIYLWALKNLMDRAIGTRGYPLGLGGGTYFDSTLSDWKTAVRNMYAQELASGDTRFTQAQLAQIEADPFNNWHTIYDGSYHINTRAVLVMADYLDKTGILNIRGTYPVLDVCLSNLQHFVTTNGYVTARGSVISTAPIVVLPPPPPTNPTQGNIAMSAPVLNGPFTAAVHFFDDAEVERSVDSVDWSATGAAHVEPSTGNVASGTYNGTGGFEITAVGHIAGAPDVTVKVGGTVPVPFPTHGRIDLS